MKGNISFFYIFFIAIFFFSCDKKGKDQEEQSKTSSNSTSSNNTNISSGPGHLINKELGLKNNLEIIIDKIDISPGPVPFHATKDGIDKGRIYVKVEVSLKNSSDGSSIMNDDFQIILADNKKEIPANDFEIAKSDLNGRYYTYTKLYFDRYQNKYIEKYIIIKGLKGTFKDKIKISRKILINPNETNSGLFFWDSIHGEPPLELENAHSQLYIENLQLSNLGNDEDNYQISKTLNLKLSKNFKISFTPKIKHFQSFHGKSLIEPLESAKLSIEVCILSAKDDNIDLQRFIKIKDFQNYYHLAKVHLVSDVEDGLVNDVFSLEVNFTHLPYFSRRSIIVAKIGLLTPSINNIQPVSITSVFNPMYDHNLVEDIPFTIGLDSLEAKELFLKYNKLEAESSTLSSTDLYKYLENSSINPWEQSSTIVEDELFKKRGNRQPLKGNLAKIYHQLKDNFLFNFLKDAPSKHLGLAHSLRDRVNVVLFWKDICNYFYLRQTLSDFFQFDDADMPYANTCERDPLQFLKITPVKIILDRPHNVVEIDSSKSTLDFMMQKVYQLAHTSREGTGNREIIGASFSKMLTFLPVLGNIVKTEIEGYYFHEDYEHKRQINGAGTLTMNRMFVSELILQFEAKTRDCIVIEGKKFEHNNKTHKIPGNVVYCNDNINEKEVLQESWYYIYNRDLVASNDPLVDGGNISNQYLTKTLRGATNYNSFRQLLDNSNGFVFLKKSYIDSEKARTFLCQDCNLVQNNLFQLNDGNYPSVYQLGPERGKH